MDTSWLDDFCGSPFWNSTLSWNTSHPDLTDCFEKTVLVWLPCLFLWIFSSVELYYYLNSKKRDIPWNWLNTSKALVNTALCVFIVVQSVLYITDSDSKISGADIYMPIIEILTYILALVHLEFNRRMGLRASGTLFLFWMLNTLLGALELHSVIHQWDHIGVLKKCYIIKFALKLAMCGLNCFPDYPPTYSGYKKSEKPCPEESSSFLSRILFSWFTPLAWQGYKVPLENSDLWDLRLEDMAKEIVPIFHKHWENTRRKCGNKKKASILPALLKSFGMTNLMAAFLKFIQDSLLFVSPTVTKWLISFVGSGEETWKGFLYTAILFSASCLQTLVLSQYFYRMIIISGQVRTALISAIYRKSLKITGFCRKDSTVGEIVNLMAVDTQKFVEILVLLNLIWSAPYQIIVAMFLLWNTLGIAVLSGVTMLILLIPINTFIISRTKKFQIKQMKYKDERIKITNEVFSGIKILKLYAWEPHFEKLISNVRSQELSEMRKAAFMNAGSNFIWSCAPFMVSLVTFTTYVLIDDKNVLDAQTAFVSITLFNILRFPMGMLPNLMTNLAQTAVSLKRINKFMNLPEIDPSCVTHDQTEDAPIVIENGNFSWGDNQHILKNIDIKLPKSSLTAVVGHVGSGKSSLISAILGEMEKTGGRVNRLGTIAYVSQQAWIQNATLRNNILFGRKYNETFYNAVIDACALREDFKMLPAGDRTEIGEKGINLSGGQKQRVNLARAVYANRDLYLMDDPLSAVDSHVAKHLFEKVIGPNGLLKKKTRVLSTHSITYLPKVDQILVLKNGRITERGNYDELESSGKAFAEFLEQHMKAMASGDENTRPSEPTTPLEAPHEIANWVGSPKFLRSQSIRDSVEVDARLSLADSELNTGQLTEIEAVKIGSVGFKIYKEYIKSIGFLLCLTILCFLVMNQSCSVGSNFWLSKWSNDSSSSEVSKRNEYLEVYGLIGFGQGLTSFLASFAFAQGFYSSSVRAHRMLLNRCFVALQSFFDTTPLGRILNRFSYDMNAIDNVIPLSLYQSLTTSFALLGTLFVITYNSPIFLVIIVFTGCFYWFIQRIYQACGRQLKRMESVSRSPIYSFFSETLTGTPIIRGYVQQDRFIAESEKRLESNTICFFYGLIANRWLAVRLELMANLIILTTALFAVFGRDTMSPGIVGLSVTYSLQITQSLSWLVRVICDVETNIVAVERVKEYSQAPVEAPWEIEETKPKDTWPEHGSVKIDKYSVRYRPGLDLVLKEIDVSIQGGEKVGIVGRTGAGKSSLTLCLFRIIEAASGTIFIDGIDISKIGLHSLRSKITIIPQDAVLFSGTLRMNLDPFNQYTDEEIWKALEHSNLKEHISACSDGLNCTIAEGGENFSIGQRQLICLSRALLRKTKLFILDEATAAIDLQTDDLIQNTIRTQFKECTIITIAHRLNTIMDYDRVIVLDRGQIREFDSPDNLIAQRGIFYSMCKEAKLV